jgi:hypothetical protein
MVAVTLLLALRRVSVPVVALNARRLGSLERFVCSGSVHLPRLLGDPQRHSKHQEK